MVHTQVSVHLLQTGVLAAELLQLSQGIIRLFEQGLLRFVEEHEDYAETHAAIAAISAQLAAAPEEGYLVLDLVA
jgi:hypothetical protein